MSTLAILAAGIVSPGLADWTAARPVLRGEAAYDPQALTPYKSALLPPNERRRATPLIQLALRAAEQCFLNSGVAPADVASVFASSGGDMGNLCNLCTQIAKEPKGISPTAFHNSVHNAVAGYFSIGASARLPSISLSAHDETFIAGLTEAFLLALEQDRPTLLVTYDMVTPLPLFAKRPVKPEFAAALLLAPVHLSNETLGALHLSPRTGSEGGVTTCPGELETLRRGNPAARVLPLLRQIAVAQSADLAFSRNGSALHVRYTAP